MTRKELADKLRGEELGKELGGDLLESLLYCVLTGFKRRELFEAEVRGLARNHSQRRQTTGCVVIEWDLNFFKTVNDTLGHDVGDQILRAFGYVARLFFRREEDLVRMGGDEFVIVVEGDDDAWVTIKAQSMQNLFSYLLKSREFYEKGVLEEVSVANQEKMSEVLAKVGVSFGVAICASRSETDIKAAIHAADQAMYQQKRDGKQERR